MKKLSNFFYFLLIGFLLTGCSPTIEYVYKDVPVPVIIPSTMFKKLPVTAPPNQTDYVGAVWREKERLLDEYIKNLLKDIKLRDVQLKSIETYQEKSVESFGKKQP